MKKNIINITIITLAFATIHIDAKRISIPVTKNEKQLFMDTKDLKNALSPEEKIAAAKKIAIDLQNNPHAQLIVHEKVLLKEIKDLEDEINQESSYISYFDTAEVTEKKAELEDLYDELEDIQKKLNKANTTQRRTTSLINNWAIATLVATVGLAIADQLISGGEVRKAIISGAGTVAGKIGTGLGAASSYVPSFGITASDVALAAAHKSWELVKGASIAIMTQKVANQMMQLLEDPNTDPTEKNEIRKTLAEWEAEKAARPR